MSKDHIKPGCLGCEQAKCDECNVGPWREWTGGTRPVDANQAVEFLMRHDFGGPHHGCAGELTWVQYGTPLDILFYRTVPAGKPVRSVPCAPVGLQRAHEPGEHMMRPHNHASNESGGGKLSGDHYYRVKVTHPIAPDVQPYTAECADIIEALGMNFNEGEAFKAIWRLAAARQGRGKPGNKAQYDADKAAHYTARMAICEKRKGQAQ